MLLFVCSFIHTCHLQLGKQRSHLHDFSLFSKKTSLPASTVPQGVDKIFETLRWYFRHPESATCRTHYSQSIPSSGPMQCHLHLRLLGAAQKCLKMGLLYTSAHHFKISLPRAEACLRLKSLAQFAFYAISTSLTPKLH
ncbi:a321f2d4-82d7-40d5-8e15-874c7bcb2090-CDS [Sclerotinia trifoliorum]|uniref:A321f2d4-82d7-40d5-8e15-874c7bcb2090-CDS n=1 Tax=Sclerotinia trifoliorum TaxID=28548 RepID=A0A8H2VPK7_9HELO|nr:a321f2d4-82d7-40d5-8e15-874c7bcb2090-CDS [Sclerotinia trifoliorum]